MHALAEVVVDAAILKARRECCPGTANYQPRRRNKEQNSGKHSPDYPAQCARTLQIDKLLGFRFFLAHFSSDNRPILQGDNLLNLRPCEDGQRPAGAIDR